MSTDTDTDCGTNCGCDFVHHTVIDGVPVQIHHVLPDDGAPHSDTSECGCGPSVHRPEPGLMVYDHVDQDPTPGGFTG